MAYKSRTSFLEFFSIFEIENYAEGFAVLSKLSISTVIAVYMYLIKDAALHDGVVKLNPSIIAAKLKEDVDKIGLLFIAMQAVVLDDNVIKNWRLYVPLQKKRKSKYQEGEPEFYFEQFWDLYPRKHNVTLAKERFVRLLKEHPGIEKEIMQGLKNQLPELLSREERFMPHASTWLNQKRFKDKVIESDHPF
jgi:hypothetical protein